MNPLTLLACSTLIWAPPVLAQKAPEPVIIPSQSAAADPMELLAGSAETWKVTPAQFGEVLGRFRPEWLDAGKTQARIGDITRKETDQRPTIIGGKLPVCEAVVHFADGVVQRVQISLYNRGDAGDISPDAFKARIESAKAAITEKAGNPGQDRGKASGAVLTKGWVWKNESTQYLLESSMKRMQGDDRPEFLRLVMVPSATQVKPALGSQTAAGKSAATATLTCLKANVKTVDGGDTYIANVPMVDQGQKGYCVVATAERVMRYYGADVDQHEMAQMADSSSGGGTNPTKMTEALDRIDSKFKLRLKRILPWTERGYLDLIKEYNRAARSNKTRQISEAETYNVAVAYGEMDAGTLKKSRATTSAVDKFKKLVRTNIDAGIPLMWSVQLGLFKEGKLPQSGGGHMRLIIGYNDTANEILFSDSWGAGHDSSV